MPSSTIRRFESMGEISFLSSFTVTTSIQNRQGGISEALLYQDNPVMHISMLHQIFHPAMKGFAEAQQCLRRGFVDIALPLLEELDLPQRNLRG